MKIRLLLFALLSFITWNAFAYGRSYPVKEVEGAFCGQTGGVCKIELPRILKADYLLHEKLARYRQVYTVMRGGTYFGGWDFGFGSHQGVDIASPVGTPIYSIGDGEVVLAENKGEWGKVIVIKHERKGEVLHSVYGHLESFEVKVGEKVKEGQLIAKMGNTGNSTGPHLHFQIDTNEGDHPFFPKGCGGTIAEVVNEARCRNQVKNNTLDPILFLETQGAIYLAERQGQKNLTTVSRFLSPYEITTSLDASVFLLGKSTQLFVGPQDKQGNAFLEQELEFEGGEHIEIYPKKISYLGSGRAISIVPKTAGLHKLTIRSGKLPIKRLSLFVLDEKMRKKLEEKADGNPALQEILSKL